MPRRRKYTDQDFANAVKNNFSIRAVLEELNVVPTGGSYKLFTQRVKKLNLDTSHFTGQGHLKGKTHNWSLKFPIEQILVKDSTYLNTSFLRKRLIKENLLSDECSRCKIKDWQGEPLSLHLDHIDGDNTNNQIDNLRLLCPNCHSQTPTYCGRNKKKN
jgi:hypothetical protein